MYIRNDIRVCRMSQSIARRSIFASNRLCAVPATSLVRARIIHERFCSNHRSAAATSLRPAGSPLGPSPYYWGLAPFFLRLSPSGPGQTPRADAGKGVSPPGSARRSRDAAQRFRNEPSRIMRASCCLAASTMRSFVKPNSFCNTFSGADAPNVVMPMMAPVGPT